PPDPTGPDRDHELELDVRAFLPEGSALGGAADTDPRQDAGGEPSDGPDGPPEAQVDPVEVDDPAEVVDAGEPSSGPAGADGPVEGPGATTAGDPAGGTSPDEAATPDEPAA